MRPAFSNALYYPTIDIPDTGWLKTAILFWDSISTIVPESVRKPYRGYDSQYLADVGFLQPLIVNPEHKSVVGIEDDILKLICSPEFFSVIDNAEIQLNDTISGGKMSNKVKESLGILFSARMAEVRYRLKRRNYDIIPAYYQPITNIDYTDDVFYLDEHFTYIYMMALASRICEDESLGMITDSHFSFGFANSVRLGNQKSVLDRRFVNYHYQQPKDRQFEQGVLLDYIIDGLSIAPDTTFEDLVNFKNHHNDELRRFRTQLTKLTNGLSSSGTISILQQEIRDLYENEFLPAYSDFKAALTGARIKWFTETCLKVSLLSASATGIPMAVMGLPVPQALLAGAGASVIASAVSYNVDKKKALRENPYSYLLSVKREWSR
jgi:hypothetical protein